MARRGIPKGPITWYLREWMDAAGIKGRGAQTKMSKLTGWSKATMSQLYNGTQDYSPKILLEASEALNCATWELLMHPDKAMALRSFQTDAQKIATLVHDSEKAERQRRAG